MANSNFTNIEGDPINVGAHGQTSFLYEEGTPVVNQGLSSKVFEAGTGLGGVALTMEGTIVDYYESAETHSEFYGYDRNQSPNAVGLSDVGVHNQGSTVSAYVLGHRDTANGSFALIVWYLGGSSSNHGMSMGWDPLEDHRENTGNPVVQDDADANETSQLSGRDAYTSSGSTTITNHNFTANVGDGAAYVLSPGSYTITLTVRDDAGTGQGIVDQFAGRGPDGTTVTKPMSVGTTFEVDVVVL